jgi:hypothetical protein
MSIPRNGNLGKLPARRAGPGSYRKCDFAGGRSQTSEKPSKRTNSVLSLCLSKCPGTGFTTLGFYKPTGISTNCRIAI